MGLRQRAQRPKAWVEQEQRLQAFELGVATKQDLPSSPEAEDAVVEASATSCFERVVRSQIEFWTLNIHTRDGEDAQDADSQVEETSRCFFNQGQEEETSRCFSNETFRARPTSFEVGVSSLFLKLTGLD